MPPSVQGYVPIYLLFGAKMPLNVETLMELAFVVGAGALIVSSHRTAMEF